MSFVRLLLLLLLCSGLVLLAADGTAGESEPRALEVLFLGDDGDHQPLERYALFKEAVGHRGIHLTYEKRMTALTEERLAGYDVLLIYANRKEITPAQLAAVEDFVGKGGGLVPVHRGLALFDAEGFVRLVGGRSESHGVEMLSARVVEPEHPAIVGYQPFETWDEMCRHHQLSDDLTVLQRQGEEPWTWVRTQGKGRIFYTAHGHDERCWKQEGFHELLARGVRWAAGDDAPMADLPELRYEVPMLPERHATRQPVPKVQQPLSPEESMRRAQVPVGFELSLFASEPDVVNPIAITWDERDRLWVVEALDYPNDLQTPGNDRVKICEDTDGDGKADRFTVFADGLSIATSVVHADGGIFITSGSQVIFMKDTDGDDRADERRVVLDGFKTHDTHAGVSNLRYGFDGWIYGTVGYAGFEGTVGGRAMKFDTGVLRFVPDGSRLEFLGKTSNNTWGLGFTENFDVLGSTANRQGSWQVVGDGGPAHRADVGTRVFPITLDVQGSDGWDPPVELLGDGRIRAKARHFTAAAGHGIYTARRFPEEWWNQVALVCEPTAHLVAIARLGKENAGFIAEFGGNNLYASSDAWSAPVAAETGPDGAVWIADWYNIIVQHNRPGAPFEQTEVERGPGAAYVTPLRDKRHGRIYRIFPAGSADPAPPADDWVAGLADPSLVRRLHAQRRIVEAKRMDLVARLKFAAAGQHGIHALHALSGLGFFHSDPAAGTRLLSEMLEHPSATQRLTALKLWPPEQVLPFDPEQEIEPWAIREWLLLAARQPADETLGRKLRAWHRSHPHLRRGTVLDRCFAAAAARHSTGFLLASLESPPDPSVLEESIYPAAIRAFADGRSPQVIGRLDASVSPLAKALKAAIGDKMVSKRHSPPVERLARGEIVYARTCAACHQTGGTGLDGAFPPLDGSRLVTGDPGHAARIVLHGMTGPVESADGRVVDSLMPPVGGLSDEEIADVLTFVRHAWSNDAPPVSPEEVAKIRAATLDRRTPWTARELDHGHPAEQ